MKQNGVREQNPQGVRHRETTRDERIKVITLHDDAGWNWSKIGQHLNIDRRTCQKIYKRAKVNGSPSNRHRTGRRPIFDNDEKQRLEAFVTRDTRTRNLSWDEICLEMGYACSPRTVKSVVEAMGYHRRGRALVRLRQRAGANVPTQPQTPPPPSTATDVSAQSQTPPPSGTATDVSAQPRTPPRNNCTTN